MFIYIIKIKYTISELFNEYFFVWISIAINYCSVLAVSGHVETIDRSVIYIYTNIKKSIENIYTELLCFSQVGFNFVRSYESEFCK